MACRVHREGVLLLGGGRALLMQIAHPSVAQGVAEHSRYRDDRWGRLQRTLRPTLAMVFGSRTQALEAADAVNRVHARVAGRGYAARDPELLLWVLATLIDTSLLMHECFVRPLSDAEKEAYYADITVIGGLLGLPRQAMPPGIADLRTYVDEMSSSLTVTPEAREIASHLFAANAVTWPAMRSIQWLTAGLMHPALRRQYGMAWSPASGAVLEGIMRASRLAVPLLPPRLKAPPWFLMP